jgi:AcrR family transcriptional regulator
MSTRYLEESVVEPLTQERRRGLTRSHLLAAAAQVFARQGFHGASIDDVAAAAGFTKGAVYSNFKNKEDLFLALMDERAEAQIAAVQSGLAEAASLPPDERSDLFRRLTEDSIWGDPDWQLLFLEFSLYAARNPPARRRLSERYHRDLARLVPLIRTELGRMDAELPLPVEDLAAVFLALFNGIGLKHATDPDNADDSLLESALAFVMYALDAPTNPADPSAAGT